MSWRWRRRSTDRVRRLRPALGAGALLVALVALAALTTAGPLAALVVPERSALAEREFHHPDLDIAAALRPPAELPPPAAARATGQLAALGLPADRGLVDVRGGRWETLLPAQPLVPGPGVGNELAWDDLQVAAPADRAALGRAAWRAARGFLQAHRADLGLDLDELAATPTVTVSADGELIQIHAQRAVDGVPVLGSYLTLAIGHGNLVLLGVHRWGDVEVSTVPALTADDARAAVQAHVEPWTITGAWGKSELVLVPTARGKDPDALAVGHGYAHRLAWVVRPAFEGEAGRFEALVDAGDGELLAFADTNDYATQRRVQGGVYPVSNDGVSPDGVEQAGWPMPFDSVSTAAGTQTADSGGNLPIAVDGNITSTLSGQFIRMNDLCGAISLTSASDLDFGASGGIDCTTPGFGGAGNTHASRTGFYELNRIKEMARGQLPGNTWLNQQLTSNMNINSTCNAFWNGSTVNFYRSGGGCSNTGELAGVFDHEWGHGMDANDATPGVSNPGEGIADIYTALRLNNSCIGRNFRPGIQCGGYGDPCTNCTGVRDIDFANRASGQPHDFTWANATCGGGVHCRGYVYSESVWDLWKRDLPALFGMDDHTAHEVVTRLTYLGAGGVGTWYSGSPPFGGCSSTGGYMRYLVADDDNGNLADGTPHMTAIFAAFDRHEIACSTPAVQNSGCTGTPTAAPTLTATPLDKTVNLSWTAVSGASGYQVFRTDGVFACDFGKIKVADTAGTSFSDGGLQNGRPYSYVVIPKGPAGTCFGPASSCATATPAAGPNLDIDAGSAVLAILTGDGDEFLDNCETGRLTFDVANTGLGTLTNVRIVGVTPVSHPATTVTTTFPSPVSPSTLNQGASGSANFDFVAGGLAFNDTLTFRVEATADQLVPITKSRDLAVGPTESDFVTFASRTFGFETDFEGWQATQGTFNRSSALGGGDGTSWALASSNGLHNQCDRARSPILRLQSTSTLTLWNNFDIEPLSNGTWYDRANVGIRDGAGARTVVTPDSGRLYNAGPGGPGNYTGCNNPEPGWAALASTWAPSGWSAAALGSVALAGQPVQLEVIYATDAALANRGFSFDEATVTDVDFQLADGQSDTCTTTCGDGTCDPGETPCNCPADCGAPPASETGLCTDTVDNDCDGSTDCADADCATDPACATPTCDNDGTCETGEDCFNCPGDCPGSPPVAPGCGNGFCEPGIGEDCLSCPADCNGRQSGNPSGRFCCGDGDGQNPVNCGDARCNSGGFVCSDVLPGGFCCGQNGCETGESACDCALDCGAPPLFEQPGLTCTDGIDNDCDGLTDCADPTNCTGSGDCPVCGQQGAPCTQNGQCCSGVCKGNGTCK